MGNLKPSHWRVFWITAAIVTAINVGFWVYVAMLPEAPIGKGGRMEKKVSEWIMGAVRAVNFPGILIYALPIGLFAENGSPEQLNDGGAGIIAVTHLLSAICWGALTAAIEKTRCSSRKEAVKPRDPNPDCAPESN